MTDKAKNKTSSNQRKIKMLFWGDSPSVATGFATVARGILNYLADTGNYDITIIGVNDRGGWKDPNKFKYKIFPALSGIEQGGDYYGRPRLITSLLGKDKEIIPPYDIIFTLNDPFILEQPIPPIGAGTLRTLHETNRIAREKLPPEWYFKVVSYFPVDSDLKPNWIETMNFADYIVMYTEYGKDQVMIAESSLDEPTNIQRKMSVITHGYNTKEFYPIDRSDKDFTEWREKFFKGLVNDDTFLVTAIARNQLRKDLPRTMRIFKEFQKRRPDSFLYLHAQETDAWGSLHEYARVMGLEIGKDWGVPAQFAANTGFSIDTINKIYNASDAIISTTLGEGLGFYNLEGMGTKTPILAPNNTVHPELFNYDKDEDITDMDAIHTKLRGIPYLSGSTSSEWATYGSEDLERVRPLGNVDDAVKKLLWIYDNPDKVNEITNRAYDWVKVLTWDKIGSEWDKLFKDVVMKKLTKERKKTKKDIKSGKVKTKPIEKIIQDEVE